MRIGILANPNSWYLADVRRAAQHHEIVPLRFDQLHSRLAFGAAGESANASLRCGCGDTTLDPLDAILVRTMPPGSLEQVVFRMDLLSRLEATGVCVVNSARAVECAVDKYLTSARMHAAGLRIPPTWVGQTADEAQAAYERLGGDVVVKPLFGGEGRGLARVSDPEMASRAFRMLEQMQAVIYLQQFVPHEGADIRILLIGDEVYAMRRRNPLDWRSNVSRGATAESYLPADEEVEMARIAARVVGARVAGVDLLPGRDGQLYAIEVNAVPGWQAIARVTGVDIAQRVVKLLETEVSQTPRGDR